jgi:hypothetical protein
MRQRQRLTLRFALVKEYENPPRLKGPKRSMCSYPASESAGTSTRYVSRFSKKLRARSVNRAFCVEMRAAPWLN